MNFQEIFGKSITPKQGYKSEPESYAGIVRSSYPNWQGWQIIDNAKQSANFLQNIERSQALASAVRLHYQWFFEDMYIEKIEYKYTALDLFEGGAAIGRRLAVRLLQQAVNLITVDNDQYYPIEESGLMSAEFVARLNKYENPAALHAAFLILVGGKYVAQPDFFRRWIVGE